MGSDFTQAFTVINIYFLGWNWFLSSCKKAFQVFEPCTMVKRPFCEVKFQRESSILKFSPKLVNRVLRRKVRACVGIKKLTKLLLDGGKVYFWLAALQFHQKLSALLEKQSKFPCYNMKCRGKPDTTVNIPISPLLFTLYCWKLITFGAVCLAKFSFKQ